METNAAKEGVVTLPSGLQYEIITEGEGAKPKAKDTVTVHYHGTTITGAVFDSSVKRGSRHLFR
jgi:FKBP-type peptidyl-prolyl cis-trans isomerase FklB